jgi:hypothetical protein
MRAWTQYTSNMETMVIYMLVPKAAADLVTIYEISIKISSSVNKNSTVLCMKNIWETC